MLTESKKILLIEDEEAIAEMVALNLENEGFVVHVAADGEEGLKAFKRGVFDLILLDLMLPKMDGLSVCEAIRIDDLKVPIIMLTAKNAGMERVKGLKAGADDYLGKPFELEELILRVQNLISRTASDDDAKMIDVEQFKIGKQTVMLKSFEVVADDGNIQHLSSREMKVLKLLYDYEGEVVSRAKIIHLIWGHDAEISSRVVDNFILSFRKIFEENPKEPQYFHSVRGEGYILKLDDK